MATGIISASVIPAGMSFTVSMVVTFCIRIINYKPINRLNAYFSRCGIFDAFPFCHTGFSFSALWRLGLSYHKPPPKSIFLFRFAVLMCHPAKVPEQKNIPPLARRDGFRKNFYEKTYLVMLATSAAKSS